jgi:lysophospholipase L1-like esterase
MHRKFVKRIGLLSVVALICISHAIAHAQNVKVACVGDSITALPSSWCGTLSTKLGSGYTVMNFGVSGTNLAKNVAQPYWNSAQYTPSHTFAPNIVIIMLGTNDAFDRSWSMAEGHFVADYKELLDTYTSLASKPKPYMIIPTPIGTSPFGHSGELLEAEVIPLIKQVAMEKMVPTIDAFTLFGGAMFDTSLFSASDQVHPNAQGQQKLGEEVYKVLMETGALGGGSAGSGAAAGAGATAGTGGVSAGAGGMSGTAGATATVGSNGAAGAGAVAQTAGGAGTGVGATSANGAGTGAITPSAGSRASAPGTTANTGTSTGVAGSPVSAGGSTASTTNPIGVAGSGVVTHPSESDDGGGCRVGGSSTTDSGPTAAFVLLLGTVIRSIRRKRSSAAEGAGRQRRSRLTLLSYRKSSSSSC